MIATLVAVRRRDDAAAARGAAGVGIGGRQRAAVRRAAARRCCGSRRTCAFALDIASEHVRTVVAQLRAGVHQPRRRADQRLHRHAAREPAADRRGHRRCRTRSCSTRCRSACSACRSSAAELPAMSGVGAVADGADAALRARLDAGLRQIAFFVVPSAVAFLALGDVIAAALLQTGRFTSRRRGVRLGHPGRLGGRPAGVDARPAVLVDLLRAARHAHAAALRARPRRADDRARLSVRDSAAATARPARAAGARPG